MMKVTIHGTAGPFEVEAIPFVIEGANHEFAVHHTRQADWLGGYKDLTATHLATGLRISHADTVEECISEARRIWASKTPEEISAAIERAMSLKKKAE